MQSRLGVFILSEETSPTPCPKSVALELIGVEDRQPVDTRTGTRGVGVFRIRSRGHAVFILKRKEGEGVIIQHPESGDWCELLFRKIRNSMDGQPKVEVVFFDQDRSFEYIRTETVRSL